MSSEPQEFEQLRKLLQLKRYEQPPPRFFNEFSSRVIAVIEAQAAQTPMDRFLGRTSWLAGFFKSLERNALVAGGFVTGVCALLVGGIVYSEYVVDQAPPAAAIGQDGAIRTAEAPAFIPVGLSSLDPVAGFSPSNSLPVVSDSLFRRVGEPSLHNLQKLSFEKVNWTIEQ